MLRCVAHGFHHGVRLARAALRFKLPCDHLAEVVAATRLWTDGLELLFRWDSYVDIDIGVNL